MIDNDEREMDSGAMPDHNRLSALVSLVLLGIAILFFIELPARIFSFIVLGSSLSFTFPGPWLVTGVLMALVWAGVDSILRAHPQMQGAKSWLLLPFGALPSLLTGASVLLLSLAPNRNLWLAGLGVAGLILYLVIIGEYRLAQSHIPGYGLIRLGLGLVAYLVALILYTMIYNTKVRSLQSATAVLLVSFILSLELLPGEERKEGVGLYSFAIGLIMGEATWALNYWRMGGLTGGILLLLLLHIMTGLAQQSLTRRLNRRTLLEFAAAALVILGVLFRYAPWFW